MFIPDPDLDFLPIPDPGVKKAPDPGSLSAPLLGGGFITGITVPGIQFSADAEEQDRENKSCTI